MQTSMSAFRAADASTLSLVSDIQYTIEQQRNGRTYRTDILEKWTFTGTTRYH